MVNTNASSSAKSLTAIHLNRLVSVAPIDKSAAGRSQLDESEATRAFSVKLSYGSKYSLSASYSESDYTLLAQTQEEAAQWVRVLLRRQQLQTYGRTIAQLLF